MTITEPLFNFQGKVIGKKETDVPLQLVSHRDLVEKHFKRYNVELVALENITGLISLNEKEEVVLFMLIGGYSQLEIGDLLGVSRSYVLKIISENLCVKFGLTIASTKLLIEKAIMLGFANFIPSKFLSTLNAK
jgi:hypothetical protein